LTALGQRKKERKIKQKKPGMFNFWSPMDKREALKKLQRVIAEGLQSRQTTKKPKGILILRHSKRGTGVRQREELALAQGGKGGEV